MTDRETIAAALSRIGKEAFHHIDETFDELRYRGQRRMRPLTIHAFAGYRNCDAVRLSGRVLEYRKPITPGTSTLSRLRAMLAVYESDEVPGVRIVMDGYGGRHETVTDDEGYFHFEIALTGRASPHITGWEEVTLAAPDSPAQPARVTAPVLAPGIDTELGIISDIDDTVVETGATNFIKNWRRVLVDRPEDRKAVPGASDLYRTLVVDGKAPRRPIFYVSSSPWNLYGFITRFKALNNIPHGPMFLKDYGIARDKFIAGGHDTHKIAAIETILAFYPQYRFLLIGDNGQQDVEVYAQVVRDFPENVAGVFIRDVSGTCRQGANGTLLAEVEATGTPVYCGSGFADAMTLVERVGFGRDEEAVRAVLPDGKAKA
ncbi:DUF2183 domain-containing protein [Pacificimonas sp. WHA3]|uniref:DUF2183 domain-containing protein n=1 Tax=Pacificimonas pallii TaxID=2827236 RepID=A0ABS6SCA1_9SPHN|nr:phosphatase domain-containing protein [Pacificimonas pallii]MBV7256009.1 DUF2183 domain-containing protein [Pacificimonas pallii]